MAIKFKITKKKTNMKKQGYSILMLKDKCLNTIRNTNYHLSEQLIQWSVSNAKIMKPNNKPEKYALC